MMLPPSITDCHSVDPITHSPSYPEASISFLIGGRSSVSITCNAKSTSVSHEYKALPKGRCESFESPTIHSQCSQVVSWSRVFVRDGDSQSRMDFEALNSTFQLMYREVDERCSVAALEYICGGIFLGCETVRVDSFGVDGTCLILTMRCRAQSDWLTLRPMNNSGDSSTAMPIDL